MILRNMILILLLITISIIKPPLSRPGDQAISLKEAIRRAYPAALAWRKSSELAYAVSTEPGKNVAEGNKGINGRKTDWNIVFTDVMSGQNLWVAVRNGQPEYSHEVSMGHTNPIKSSDLRYDSISVISILKSGQHWDRPAKIHFELIYNQSPLLRVYQTNRDAGTTITWIDPRSGHIVLNRNGTVN